MITKIKKKNTVTINRPKNRIIKFVQSGFNVTSLKLIFTDASVWNRRAKKDSTILAAQKLLKKYQQDFKNLAKR